MRKSPFQELQVGGLSIEFEKGITEQEVKAILENCIFIHQRMPE